MPRVAAITGLAIGLSGCFYTDPINDRPRIEAVQRVCPTADPGSIAAPLPCDAEFDAVFRGDLVQVRAMAHDPDGSDTALRFAWQVFACGTEATCDASSTFHSDDPSPMTQIPRLLSTAEPVQLVHILVDTMDDRGAHQTAVRSVVLDDGPTLGVRAEPDTTSIGGPIGVFATYGDPDGAASDVTLAWSSTSPTGKPGDPPVDRAIVDPAPDATHPTVAKTFTLREVGDWTITVIATDALGKQAQQLTTVHVLDDQPPCIAQWQPIAAVAPDALPVAEPTLFQVPLVSDDLDPYPATASGAAGFAWSIRPPGQAAFQAIAATGNSVAFDPSAYRPGDVVELRVEISDRIHAQVGCAADAATCSLDNNSCIQRQTWRIEAR